MDETEKQTFVQSVLDALLSNIAVLDKEGKIICVNESWNRFARQNGDPMLTKTGVGVNYLDVTRKAAASDALAGVALSKIQEVMDGALPSATLEYPCHSPGEKRWFRLNASPLGAEPFGVVTAHENITARRLTEEAYAQSEEKYRSIFDNAADLIAIIDVEGNFIDLNHKFEEESGYRREQMLGKNVFSSGILTEASSEKAHHHLQELLEGKPSPIFEVYGVRTDGGLVPYELRAVPLKRNGEILGVQAILRNISQRKRAEKEIETYTRRLEESNKALQDFAAFASHDLQEPLRKIRSFGEVLESNYRASLDEVGQDYLRRMGNAAERMSSLIEDLLNYSRVTTRAKPFRAIDLKSLLEEVLSDLEFQVQRTGAAIQVENLPTISGDPSQMRQVFQNLIGNSLKFSKERPVIRVSGQSHEHHLEISVEDNGIGFDEKKLHLIFRPFQRLHGRSAYEGKGMGLAIVKRIVERHGGKITARSRPGEGSKFVLTLPAYPSPEGEP